MILKPTTVPDRPQAYGHAPRRTVAASYRRRQRRASQTYAFQVTQRSLTPIDVRRVAQVHGASGGGRTWHMPKDEFDARPGCAANALNQVVYTDTSNASDELDTKTWELCRELPPLPEPEPEPEPELVFRKRERERKAPPIRAREVALPLREPRNDALRLG
jgi:hypothetical protein